MNRSILLAVFFLAACQSVDVRSIDGDTIIVGSEHIRIANIDTPEILHAQCDAEKRLGLVAKRRMGELLLSGALTISRGDPADGRMKDRYGRTLAIVLVDGVDVGETLVSEGLARRWTGRREPWCGQPAS